MKPNIKSLKEWEVAMEWIRNGLARNWPQTVFSVEAKHWIMRKGTTIRVKYVDGVLPPKSRVTHMVESHCYNASHIPGYGKTSNVKGEYHEK